MKSKEIAGVKVNFDITYQDVIDKINEYVKADGQHYIWTVNPEFIMAAQKDESFKEVLNESSISTPDGVGTIFAEKYLEMIEHTNRGPLFPLQAFIKGVLLGISTSLDIRTLPERVTGVDLIFKICENAAAKGQTVLLLGGWEKDIFGKKKEHHGNVARKAADALQKEYPGLKVIDAVSDFKRTGDADEETLAYIHKQMEKSDVKSIDVVFVAYGHGYQEKWIKRNLHKIPAKVGLGLGGTFDYVAQFQHRSPKSFVKRNMDWLYRLITQPWRLPRTFKAFPVFPLFVYLWSLKTPERD